MPIFWVFLNHVNCIQVKMYVYYTLCSGLTLLKEQISKLGQWLGNIIFLSFKIIKACSVCCEVVVPEIT